MASSAPEPQPQGQAGAVPVSESPQSSAGDPSAQWLSALPLPSVPDHELLRCVGRGAYGAVWLAQNVMGAYRAVKIVHGEDFTRERPFTREYEGLLNFEPVSRSHPNLMQILHVGRRDSYFYYVTELADDANAECGTRSAESANASEVAEASRQSSESRDRHGEASSSADAVFSSVASYVPRTLQAELERRGRLPIRDCLRVAVALASALKHLHDHQLIHRDVKPSNVIFVHGVPKLADIGLVATVGDSRSIVGTEGYLAPEGPGNPQADLYALGKLLYEASTGMSRGDYPRLPQNLRELPDAKELLEFNEVLLKTCARDTERRYHSADELLADLALLERGDSVKRLRRLERHQVMFKRAGVAVLLAGLLVSAAWWQSWRGQRIANRNLALLHVDKGTQRMVDGDYAAALPWLVGALQLDSGSPDRERAHRMRIASVLARCPRPVARFYVPESKAVSADLSPDGSMLATAHENGMVRLWNTRTGQMTPQLPHDWPVVFCQFLPSGNRMLTATVGQKTHIWDLATPGRDPTTLSQAVGMQSDAYSMGLNPALPRAEYLAKGAYRYPQVHSFTGLFEYLTFRLKLVGQGDTLLVGHELLQRGRDGDALCRDEFRDSPGADAFFQGRDNPPAPVWGRVMVMMTDNCSGEPGSESGQVIWDELRVRRYRSGEQPPPWRVLDDFSGTELTNWVHGCSPDSKVTCRMENGRLVLSYEKLPRKQEGWTGLAWLELFLVSPGYTLEFEADLVSARAPHPQVGLSVFRPKLTPFTGLNVPRIQHGRWLPLFWWDGKVQIWDLVKDAFVASESDGRTTPLEIQFSRRLRYFDIRSDGRFLAVFDGYARYAVWDLATGLEVARAAPERAGVNSAKFSPDNRLLAVSHEQGLDLVNTKDWQIEHRLPTWGAFADPQFSPRATRLAAVRDKREVEVWDLDVWFLPKLPELLEPLARFSHQSDVQHIAFSSDGRYLVSSTANGVVQVWDVFQGVAFGPPVPGVLAWFGPDDTQLLVLGDEGGVWLWDLSRVTNDTLTVSPLPMQQMSASSKDGAMTAEIKSRGISLRTPTGQYSLDHPVPLRRVAFTTDDRYLIAESGDMRAWVWDVRARMLLGPPRATLFDVSLTDHSLPALRVEDREQRRLSELAALLGGQRPDGAGGMMPLDDLERGQLFDELKKAHASEFKVDEADRERWHRRHAEEAERALDWDAAVFHWELVLRGKSEIRRQKTEISVEQRLAYARQAADAIRNAMDEGRSRWSVILPRPPWVKPQMLDLTPFYNRRLGELDNSGQNNSVFRCLGSRLEELGGMCFDARGIIHVGLTNQVRIPLGRPCERLHFLQAASNLYSSTPGLREIVGNYMVTYASGQNVIAQLYNPDDLPPYYGHPIQEEHDRNWENPTPGIQSVRAWSAYRTAVDGTKRTVFLTRTTWELPPEHRGEIVETLELQAGPAESAPLILAITIE